MKRLPTYMLLTCLAVGIPSAATGQQRRNVELLVKVGGTSESWVRRSGIDGDWLGLSRGFAVGAGVVVPVLHPRVALHATLEGTLGSRLLKRTYVGPSGCLRPCEPPGHVVEDLRTAASSFTASLAASVKVFSLGSTDVHVLGGLGARRTGLGNGRPDTSASLSGMSWGWVSELSVERRVGSMSLGLALREFSEHRRPSRDPRIMGDFPVGAWSDQAISATVRLPSPLAGR